MIDIKSIYILDGKGQPIYMRELSLQGEQNPESILYTNIVTAIQQFVQSSLGEKEAKIIQLGDFKIYHSKDHISNLSFIIKCNLKIKEKKAFSILKQIKNLFIDKFIGKFSSSSEEKNELMQEFIDEMDKNLFPNSEVENLLGNL